MIIKLRETETKKIKKLYIYDEDEVTSLIKGKKNDSDCIILGIFLPRL